MLAGKSGPRENYKLNKESRMKKRETEFWILVVVVSTIVILLTLMCVTLCKAVQLEKYESLSINTEQPCSVS